MPRRKIDRQAILDASTGGASSEELAAQFGIPRAQVEKVLEDQAQLVIDEKLRRKRMMVLMRRLEKMTAILWPRVEKGDMAAIQLVTRLGAREAALLGLFATPATNVTVNMTAPEQQKHAYDELREALRAFETSPEQPAETKH